MLTPCSPNVPPDCSPTRWVGSLPQGFCWAPALGSRFGSAGTTRHSLPPSVVSKFQLMSDPPSAWRAIDAWLTKENAGSTFTTRPVLRSVWHALGSAVSHGRLMEPQQLGSRGSNYPLLCAASAIPGLKVLGKRVLASTSHFTDEYTRGQRSYLALPGSGRAGLCLRPRHTCSSLSLGASHQ